MKNVKKLLAAALLIILTVGALIIPSSAAPTTDQLIRYIPTTMTISKDKVVVDGYFANLNTDVTAADFRNVEMEIWDTNELIVSGSFSTLQGLTLRPSSCTYYRLTFNSSSNFNILGTYDCDEETYAVFSADFSATRSGSSPSGSTSTATPAGYIWDMTTYVTVIDSNNRSMKYDSGYTNRDGTHCKASATQYYAVYNVREGLDGYIYFTFAPDSSEIYHTLPINYYTYRPTEGRSH